MNTPADSNTRENANTNTDISITANATGFSTKTLNPQILVTLWNVERLGSFSAVARETGWSQPAISQQIRKVERELDAKLVQRTSHGVGLTPIGRILARHGQLIDNRVTQAVKDVEEYQRNGSTHIRLVAPPSVCSSFVARVLVHISKTSDIRVSLMQMEPPEAMDALEQGLADCAIIFQYNSLPALVGPDDLEVSPSVSIR
ncbi:LysR family transcriptional regulator [Bifidobacterium catenulatum]|nr:LysR family transcriptional regulator [Bifidobacterium catenulatum]